MRSPDGKNTAPTGFPEDWGSKGVEEDLAEKDPDGFMKIDEETDLPFE